MNLYDESVFYGGSYKHITKKDSSNYTTIQLEKIANPKLLEFTSFGENTYYITRIIISPGDNVSYTLKDGNLEFTGKKAAHYNFYLEMDSDYDDWSKLYLNKYQPDFKKYKQQCDSLYKKRVTFFNEYVKKHPTVSDEFKKIIKDDLRFEYLVNLIKPRSETQGSWNVNTGEDLINMYERGHKQEGEFFDINGYLNNITIDEVNQPEYLNYLYFKMSIVPLLRQKFVKSSEIPYSIASFRKESTFLKENFDQKIIDYAMGRLIVDYFNQGFGKDNNTADFMKEVIENYKQTVHDSSTIMAMKDIEIELSAIDKEVPKDLKELVLNLTKDTVNFNFALQQKKIKIIDFWASWCQPCVEEIIVSKYKREQIAKDFNVEFLYLSIDKDVQRWVDKSIDLYEFLPNKQQYKILNYKKSKLIKFLQLKRSFGLTIPRYVILDENNKIIDNNAPKPSSAEFEKVINKLIN